MAERTAIEWCDSTLNLQMGCDGCELTTGPGPARCYAKVVTDRTEMGFMLPTLPRLRARRRRLTGATPGVPGKPRLDALFPGLYAAGAARRPGAPWPGGRH
jgi:hypothetical protein